MDALPTDNVNMEVWKDIPPFDNYEVSSLGNIRNKKTKYVFKSKSPKHRYVQVILPVKTTFGALKYKSLSLHRLVAAAFVEKVENKPFVNHIDGDKRNNCVSNLEWVSQSENMKHASNSGLTSKTNSLNEIIELLDTYGEVVKEFKTQTEAADYFKVNQSDISRLLTHGPGPGRRKFRNIKMMKNEILVQTFQNNMQIARYFDIPAWKVSEILRKQYHLGYVFDVVIEIPNIRLKNTKVTNNEIWKTCAFSEKHLISNEGRLYNKETKKYISGSNDGRYMRFKFERYGPSHGIHRLVAHAFIDNLENKPYVNHIDGNTFNNRADNLEWVTQCENMFSSLKCGKNHSAKKVIQYSKTGDVIRIWDSMRQIRKHLKIEHSKICLLCETNELVNDAFSFSFDGT